MKFFRILTLAAFVFCGLSHVAAPALADCSIATGCVQSIVVGNGLVNTGTPTSPVLSVDAPQALLSLGLSASSPVCTDANGNLTTSGCAAGGGGITSVTNTDGNLTIDTTTTPGVADIELTSVSGVSNVYTQGSITGRSLNITGSNSFIKDSSFVGHGSECLEVGSQNIITPTGSPCGTPITSTSFVGLGTVTVDNMLDSGLAASSNICTDASSNLTTTGCSSGSGGGTPMMLLTSAGGTLLNPLSIQPYNDITYYVPAGMVIGHINVTCPPFNPVDAAVGNSNYHTLDVNGLGGGTINFGIINGTYSGNSPLILGSVVIPDSPQAGPWVTSVTSAVSTPYAVLPGDALVLTVPSVSTTATQWVAYPQAFAGP